jgi:diaminopimelate epimerase
VALRFDKYEGLGNDFVVIEAARAVELSATAAQRLCDRHFGVGADGVLLVLPPESARSRARMVVLNADGSRPEMCGNGLRCVALHLALRDGAVAETLTVDTDAGSLGCEIERTGERARVRVEMGQAELLGEHRVVVDGEPLVLLRVATGNPHAILFGGPADPGRLDRIGPAVSESLPGGSNVEIVEQRGARDLGVVVWERGVGRTLACGTGAVAAAAAACSLGRSPFGEPLRVELPGGALEVVVEPSSLRLAARGPARRVFSGEVREP